MRQLDQQAPDLAQDEKVVNRAVRRRISGVVYLAQKSRLVLDAPDAAGQVSYPCRVCDFSKGGFGVILPALSKPQDALKPGDRLTLEAWNGQSSRVEIRWIKKDRIGLKCVNA